MLPCFTITISSLQYIQTSGFFFLIINKYLNLQICLMNEIKQILNDFQVEAIRI